MTKFVVFILLLTLMSVNPNGISDDDRFRWYSIVSKAKHCNCELAVEIPTTRANCPLTKLIACPYDNTSVYQHWRWDGFMLKSRLNGLVWDLDNLKPRHVVLAHATNSSDQQFRYNKKSHQIDANYERYRGRKVVDITDSKRGLFEAQIIIYNKKNGKPSINQIFQFRAVQL